MKLNEWIVNGDVGISSKTIWSVLQGVKKTKGDKPYDPDDFSRCYKLVKECNISQEDLNKVAENLPYWKPYIDNWGKLTEMFELNEKNKWVNYNKVGMYEFMQELRKESDIIGRS